ncbi:MAG: DUF2065 family protein [Steroidobacteraceae bacterium]|nr:DUF2065 family protein [Steroidobacteraceae bacterium]
MSIEWSDLAAALGLVLVFEGLLPFLSPAGLRRAAAAASQAGDAALRSAGAACMAAGLLLLWFVRS